MSREGDSTPPPGKPPVEPFVELSTLQRDDPPRLRLLIGTDAGYQSIVRAATKIHRAGQLEWPLLVLLGAEETFPFRPRPSTILVQGMPAGVIACSPQLDEFGIASRLASTAGLPGCHDGTVTELAELWLQSLQPEMLKNVYVEVSGNEETVRAVESLARRLNVEASTLPTQGISP